MTKDVNSKCWSGCRKTNALLTELHIAPTILESILELYKVPQISIPLSPDILLLGIQPPKKRKASKTPKYFSSISCGSKKLDTKKIGEMDKQIEVHDHRITNFEMEGTLEAI